MHWFSPAAFALLILLPPMEAAMAQDILEPLQHLVEDLVPDPAPRPEPAPADEPEPAAKAPPPMPRPRPEDRDGPDVTAAATGPAPAATAPSPDRADPAAPEGPGAAERVYQVACPALLNGTVVGKMLPPVADGLCASHSPLLLTGLNVNGHRIGFASPVTTNCAMAGALAEWAGAVDLYADAVLGSPLDSLASGPGLVCRNRYGDAGRPVSEHAFANALDVTGFTLANGEVLAVKAGWTADNAQGRFLRQAHGAACGRFTTVLGPEANAAHAGHFHLDLGCHGQSCTARICE